MRCARSHFCQLSWLFTKSFFIPERLSRTLRVIPFTRSTLIDVSRDWTLKSKVLYKLFVSIGSVPFTTGKSRMFCTYALTISLGFPYSPFKMFFALSYPSTVRGNHQYPPLPSVKQLFENFVTGKRLALSSSAKKLSQNDNQFAHFPLNCVIDNFVSFVNNTFFVWFCSLAVNPLVIKIYFFC